MEALSQTLMSCPVLEADPCRGTVTLGDPRFRPLEVDAGASGEPASCWATHVRTFNQVITEYDSAMSACAQEVGVHLKSPTRDDLVGYLATLGGKVDLDEEIELEELTQGFLFSMAKNESPFA